MYPKKEIILCFGSSCFARGNKVLTAVIQKFIRTHNLSDKVAFRGDHCLGHCQLGPNIKVDGRIYHEVDANNVVVILSEALKDII